MIVTNRKINFSSNKTIQKANEELIFSNDLAHEKILCIGDVQSGKTGMIIDSIQKALEKGYRSTIIFAGSTKILVKQTHKRLENQLKSKKFTIVEVSDKKDLNSSLHMDFKLKNMHIVFCLLKSSTIGKKLKWIYDYFKQHFALEEGILMIDDECDSYSLLKRKELSEQKNIANTIFDFYGKIILLKTHKIKFLSVTATPFDNLSFFNVNPYDRSILLNHSIEYTGNEYFNKLDDFYISIDSNKKNKETWERIIKIALEHWLCSTFLMLNDGWNKQYIKEITSKKEISEIEKNQVDKISKSEFLINIDTITPSHDEILKILVKHFHQLDVEEIIKRYHFDNKLFLDFIRNLSKICRIYLINNDKETYNLNFEKTIDEYESGRLKYQILIGGNLISRGLTINNLITTIMLSSGATTSVDTLLQKARWFGYRQISSKWMRVFTNNNIRDKYLNVQKHLNFIHEYGNNLNKLINYKGQKI